MIHGRDAGATLYNTPTYDSRTSQEIRSTDNNNVVDDNNTKGCHRRGRRACRTGNPNWRVRADYRPCRTAIDL
jgi:hypothetical protein